MRTCIQLGLGYSTEFLGLTRENWVAYSKNCIAQLQHRGKSFKKDWIYSTKHTWAKVPAVFADNPEPFIYWGIDASPESISILADKHQDNERANFICVGTGNFEGKDNDFYLTKANIDYGDHRYQLNSTRINFLIMPFSQILKLIDPPTFDVLAVDIDGHEPGLIKDMENWHLYPEFLSMELYVDNRNYKTHDVWHDQLKPYGYTLIDFIEHPAGKEWGLHECQYIRK